jgi:hypothetical protein
MNRIARKQEENREKPFAHYRREVTGYFSGLGPCTNRLLKRTSYPNRNPSRLQSMYGL